MALNIFRSRTCAVVNWRSPFLAAAIPAQQNTLHNAFALSAARAFAGRTAKPLIKDPECPKRPASSWVRFLADFRATVNKAEVPPQAVMQIASAKWKALPETERKPYEEQAEADKKVHAGAMQKYVESGKKAAWARDPAKPKRPLSGFMRFAADFRVKHPELKMTEQASQAAKAWKELGEVARAPYVAAYLEEKLKYDKADAAYKGSAAEQAWKKKVGIKAQEELQAKAVEKEKAAKEKVKKLKKLKLAEKAKECAAKRKVKEAAAKEKAKAKDAKAKEKEKVAKAKAKAAAAKEKEAAAAKAKAEKKKQLLLVFEKAKSVIQQQGATSA